jgi:hypothetical protein
VNASSDDKQFKSWLDNKNKNIVQERERVFPPFPTGSISIPNERFLQDYHNRVVTEDKVGKSATPEGNEVEHTMLLSTVGIDNKHYILPYYNPETGKQVPFNSKEEGQWLKKFMPDIQSGRIVGYSTPEEAHHAMEQIRNRILAQTPKI